MEMVSACSVVQDRVVLSPWIIVCGLAVMVAVGRGTTVTVTEAVAVPPGPTAVMVYVVSIVGETVVDPLA